MMIAVASCAHCDGPILTLVDGYSSCAACGRDPDAPARPPTREERRLSANDNKVNRAFNFNAMFRDGRIIELHNAGVGVAALSERYGLSKTRIQAIVKTN